MMLNSFLRVTEFRKARDDDKLYELATEYSSLSGFSYGVPL